MTTSVKLGGKRWAFGARLRGVALTISNEDTLRKIRRLAELTGQSQAAAIQDAVRRRLNELERTQSRPARREAMMRIARESAALMDPDLSTDPSDILYNQMGMPS